MGPPGRIAAGCALACLSLLPTTAHGDYAMIWHEQVDVSFDFITRPPETMIGDLDGDDVDETSDVDRTGTLRIQDGATESIAYTTTAAVEVQAMCLFDFDDDGTLEVILAGEIDGVRSVAIVDHVGAGAPSASGAVSPPPPSPRILGVNPNPFNPSTLISFTLASEGAVEVRIYDINGRLTRSLLREPRAAGVHVVSWDGRDDSGRQLASGQYFCRLSVDGQAVGTQRVVMLK